MELTKHDIDFFVNCLKFLLHTKGKRVGTKTITNKVSSKPKKKVRVRLEKTKTDKKLDKGLLFISSKNPLPPITNRVPINWG